jgi:hypothetical protein
MKVFYCPFCNQCLSQLEGSIIKLLGKLKGDRFETATYIYIPGNLGQFDAIIEGRFIMKDGLKVDFCCTNPKCEKSFTTAYDDDLAEIKMVDDDGHEYVVVFNRIYGKHSTFVVDYKKKELSNAYGEDKNIYLHDFNKSM